MSVTSAGSAFQKMLGCSASAPDPSPPPLGESGRCFNRLITRKRTLQGGHTCGRRAAAYPAPMAHMYVHLPERLRDTEHVVCREIDLK